MVRHNKHHLRTRRKTSSGFARRLGGSAQLRGSARRRRRSGGSSSGWTAVVVVRTLVTGMLVVVAALVACGGGGGGRWLPGLRLPEPTDPFAILAPPQPRDEETLRRRPGGSSKNLQPQHETNNTSTSRYHFVVASDCNDEAQDWQAYVLVHRFVASGQEGRLTRIVHGCAAEGGRRSAARRHHEDLLVPLVASRGGDLRIHFSPPHPSQAAAGSLRTHTKHFNRPHGILHWMEHELGYGNNDKNNNDNPNPHDDTVVVILEPDTLLLEAFPEGLGGGPTADGEAWKADRPPEPGQPFAQHEAYPPRWWEEVPRTDDGDELSRGISRLQRLGPREVNHRYAAEAPFFATARDLYSLIQTWDRLAGPLYDRLGEKALKQPRAGHTLAAVLTGQPHALATTLVAWDRRSEGFGRFLDAIQLQEEEGGEASALGVAGSGCGHEDRPTEKGLFPHALRYKQRYSLGDYTIGKHYVPAGFLGGKPSSCHAALLEEPPSGLSASTGYFYDPEKNHSRVEILPAWTVHTEAFLLCRTIRALNEAARHYKDHHCPAAADAPAATH